MSENPHPHGLRQRPTLTDRPDTCRAAGLTFAAADELKGSHEQIALHREERSAEANATRVRVVDEDSRRVARLLTGVDRESDVTLIAHQQQLRHMSHGTR